MKKNIKHIFKHKDPEKEVVKEKIGKTTSESFSVPAYIFKDLKKSVITISIFIIIFVALYFFQQKVNLLEKFFQLLNL